VNDSAVGTHLDLDLLGVLGVTTGKQRLTAAGADTSLRRQFPEFLAGQQVGIIAAPGAGVPRLLAPVPPRHLRRILGIVEVMGAIV
jgi:hypothetical protein